ncbi:MAG TPA: Bax inhibitor-1/YccA family protein [Chloroflexota bacterium]|nr:Bax inhibitor-1/YccA family protein [Chloroflexota bacterium]
MYDYSRRGGLAGYGTGAAITDQPAVLGRVMGLLGFAFLFTAGGAVIGRTLGPGAFLLSIVGSFGTLIALQFLRDRAPLNLGLLYAFATFEGIALGLILETYIGQGLGDVVFNAAATTAAVTLAAGAYGYTTKRDLTGLGGILFVGLIGVIVASVVGIFIHLPVLYVGISIVAAILFTGFLIFDLNRVANSRGATEGQAILLAVSVYLDIFNLFLALLRLFGYGGSSRD